MKILNLPSLPGPAVKFGNLARRTYSVLTGPSPPRPHLLSRSAIAELQSGENSVFFMPNRAILVRPFRARFGALRLHT